MATKIHWHNKINGTIKRRFGKNMLPSTKLRLYNIKSKAALKYEVCVLNLKRTSTIRNSTNEISEIMFRIDKVRHSKQYNNSRKTKSRTHSR
jgi:hypothetical protein